MRSNAVAVNHGDFLQASVFTSQNAHAREHEACIDWAAWSRSGSSAGPKEGGNCPKLATPEKTFAMARAERVQARITAINPRTPTMRFAASVGGYQDPLEQDEERDLRRGENVDEILHNYFDVDMRSVLHAVYVLIVPAYQWPQWARVKAHRFGELFDASLGKLGNHLTA